MCNIFDNENKHVKKMHNLQQTTLIKAINKQLTNQFENL